MQSFPNLIPFEGGTEEERLQRWRDHLKELEDYARKMTAETFSKSQSNEACVEWLDTITHVEGENLASVMKPIEQLPEEQRSKLMPACHMGCSHCCFQIVTLDIPELVAMYEYIMANCDEETIERYRANARWYRKQFEALEPGTHPNLTCPVLIHDLCSVYEARPIVCRGFASLNEEKCRARKWDKYNKLLGSVPIIVPLKSVAHTMRHGVYLGLADAGRSNKEVVLGVALNIIFEDPKAVEKHWAGEDVFAPAWLPDWA